MDPVEVSVLATIAYHDVLELPLTAWEAWRYAVAPSRAAEAIAEQGRVVPWGSAHDDAASAHATPDAILTALTALASRGVLREEQGYWCLAGREHLADLRTLRREAAEDLWHAVRGAVGALRGAPFVEGVALAGSMARGVVREGSDIDLLVLVRPGRIWTARVFLTLLAALSWRLRPGFRTRWLFPLVRPGVAGKLCLNHYAAATTPLANRSLHTALSHARLLPLWGVEAFTRFWEANGPWLRSYVPHALAATESRRMAPAGAIPKAFRRVFEVLLGGWAGQRLEGILGAAQRRLIAKNPLTATGGGFVLAGESELAFHPEPRDREVIDKFGKNMLQYLFWG